MGILLSTRRAAMGAPTYVDKVLSYAPIAYWPLWETAGAVAACSVNPLQNGAAVGVTWNDALGPDGVNGAPYFDGANDYVNIYTATFDAAFSGATGTTMIWCRVNAAAVWTDGVTRRSHYLFDDANNYNRNYKSLGANQYSFSYAANAAAVVVNVAPYSNVNWFCAVNTWSDSAGAGQFMAFIDGAQQGITQPIIAAWNGGGLDNTATVIGAASTVPATVWHGWLAHMAVWDTVLTPAEIAILANPAP